MIYLFYLGRILFGGYFVYSGYSHFAKLSSMSQYAASKGIPAPKAMVSLSGLLILLGGFWILTGVYIGIGVAELVVFLIVVSFKMHDFWNETDPMQKMMSRVQFMKNMALLGATLMLLQIPVANWGWTLF